jgi:O-antigen/teichoic acid export membrane protein
MSILAHPLILLAMGEKWSPAIPIICVLAVTTAVRTLGMISYPLAMATGNTKLLLKRSFQALTFRLPILVGGLYFDGMPGLLLARSLLCVVTVLLDMLVVKQICKLGIIYQILVHWRALESCCAMVLFARLMSAQLDFGPGRFELLSTLLAMGAATGLVYVACTFWLWMIAGKPEGPEREILRVLNGSWGYFGLMRREMTSRS